MTALVHCSGTRRDPIACGAGLSVPQSVTADPSAVTCPRCLEAMAGGVEAALREEWVGADVYLFGPEQGCRAYIHEWFNKKPGLRRRYHWVTNHPRYYPIDPDARAEFVVLPGADPGLVAEWQSLFDEWRWHEGHFGGVP